MRGGGALIAIVIGSVLLGGGAAALAPAAGVIGAPAHGDPCPHAQPVPAALRLPATVPPGEPTAIEQRMLHYLYGDDPNRVPSSSPNLYPYRRLGWCVDKYVRDTGPYVHGQYYGTHPAIRIYYSPEMMTWLRNGRRGVPADGAVIIKEQYNPAPAAIYTGLGDDRLQPHDWTVMIRRTSASRDGWFWAEVYTKTASNGPMTFGGTQYPNAGFGLYCLRCHASANIATTFASLNNIKGFAGEPLTFKIDDSWRTTPEPRTTTTAPTAPRASAHAAAPTPVQTFPAEALDTMFARHHGVPQFLTSDQCMGCHSAASGAAYGPSMWLTPPPSYKPPPSPPPGPAGVNVSEYGEWRWSPMGLAGRDPVFFSQLESEKAYIETIPNDRIAGSDPQATRAKLKTQVVDACMRCHGVMGKRANDIDNGPNAHFDERWVFQADPTRPSFHYGGLARDGISCSVCHHITQTPRESASLAYTLEHTNTGQFSVGPPEKLHGPFKTETIASHPMKESLGAAPVFAEITKSARLCASCHSIDLPVVDAPAKIHPIVPEMGHDVEQNTYVEWVNSRYQTEYRPLAGAKSCQDCHMPASVANDRIGVRDGEIRTRIALVQDETYPQSEHRAPLDEITVRYRQHGYRRHELLGLNAFLLRTFQTKGNDDILGVRPGDYMSGSSTDLDDAIGNVVRQARTATAKLDLATHIDGGTLVADVGVTNLTGHRFPSGVGFRRAWIELRVTDSNGATVWSSGSTNTNGEIVDGADNTRVLPTEYFTRGADGKQRYQEHFDLEHPVVRTDQVQIFEELTADKDGRITLSFLRRDHHLKDNRLLPQGWRRDGPPGITLPRRWLEATHPEGAYVDRDPNYANGSGRALVRYRVPLRTATDPAQLHVAATLWYQAWEPNFRRARTTGNGPAATRLRVLLDNVRLDDTPLRNWKLEIASVSSSLSPRRRAPS